MQEDLPEYYAAADALVIPSYSESFGLVALEAMSCGVPVIATRLGAFAERIEDGVDGFLVDPTGESVLGCLRPLASERDALNRVAVALRDRPVRTAAVMGRGDLRGFSQAKPRWPAPMAML